MDKLFETYVKQGWSDEKYEEMLKDQEAKKYIGQRVVGIEEYDGVDLKGKKGTVVDVIERKGVFEKKYIAVRWDEYDANFHNLGGRVPMGYGFWCNERAIRIIQEDESET